MQLKITRLDIPEGGSIVVCGAISDFHVLPGDFFCAEPETKTVAPETKSVAVGAKNEEKQAFDTANYGTETKTVAVETKSVAPSLVLRNGCAVYANGGATVGVTPLSDIEYQWVEALQNAGKSGLTLLDACKYVLKWNRDGIDDGNARMTKSRIEAKFLTGNIPYEIRSEVVEETENGRSLRKKYFFLEPSSP